MSRFDVGAIGELVGAAVTWLVLEVLYQRGGVRRQMHHLVVYHFGFGDLEDDHCGREDDRQQAESEGLPRLEGDQGEGQGHQGTDLELEAEQEGDDDLAQHATPTSA